MSFLSANSYDAERVRSLARLGRLADEYSAAEPENRRALWRGVHEIAVQVVFQRITQPLEGRRRHRDCLSGVDRLRPECLDRFHEAVEAVAGDALRKAGVPILRLDAWMAARAHAATVDHHRVQRGTVGAQQKPRVPGWLQADLGGDGWLIELALAILTWVGVPDTAGSAVWPVDAWSERRAAATGDYAGNHAELVGRDIEGVLAAMRHRPDWYAKYVERPLGHKRPAVCHSVAPTPLALVEPGEQQDLVLRELAAQCLDIVRIGLTEPGRDQLTVVSDAIRTTFGEDRLDQPDVGDLLAEPADIGKIVAVVLDILDRAS